MKNQLFIQLKELISEKKRIKILFWVLAILLGVLQAWANRYSISTADGISYLDIGDAYMRGDWQTAINGYWSPLYSWILGITFFILKPSAYWEFPLVNLVNFTIYLGALVSFEFWLGKLLEYQNKITLDSQFKSVQIPIWVWLVLGYTLFLWSSLHWITVRSNTPDMIVAALVYLASGIILHISTKTASWLNVIALGAVLGLAYLAKAVMFPLSFIFLAVAMLAMGNLRQVLPRIMVALLVFTLVTTPFITALSLSKGHLTFGETGKLNYAWSVNPGSHIIPDVHWQGEPPGYGTPKHPTRQILGEPKVFEFATPVGGTYPPWTDPSYWYEGIAPPLAVDKQLKVIAKNLMAYNYLFLGSLVFGYLILVGVGGKFRSSLQGLAKTWHLLVPALAGLGVYLLAKTPPSTRLIAPFIVLLFAGTFLSICLSNSQKLKRLIALAVVVIFLIVSYRLSYDAVKDVAILWRKLEHTHWQIANSLKQLGIQPGNQVAIAVIDETGTDVHTFWARLARVNIIAEIHADDSVLTENSPLRFKVFKMIEATGSRAIVVGVRQSKLRNSLSETGWQRLGKSDFYVYFLEQSVTNLNLLNLNRL
ncbi:MULTISPECIES: hypothetical protein [unclassified Coleofasciculus]|uniref:hypothetical protein n=1 Tax=unclassified Coleofasciculus TaxID=2692782 RepID=UPI0018821E91|nr:MULTISPECIES: hypothetical protein [unclassified Coleofasciculus]MBE9125750.1 hypothetical protein [Coleofasciculus sp. LEGE 07081]MBE9147238.1 hypothetical protein [Coleofasciculus sp. LEGE 07092]